MIPSTRLYIHTMYVTGNCLVGMSVITPSYLVNPYAYLCYALEFPYRKKERKKKEKKREKKKRQLRGPRCETFVWERAHDTSGDYTLVPRPGDAACAYTRI